MQVGLDVLACLLDGCLGGFVVSIRNRLHRVDDDRDEQVEHGEGGNQDERDEEHPGVGEYVHQRAHDAHRPAFQRHHLE